jgi:hypothetical protein
MMADGWKSLGASFETAALQPPQDEGLSLCNLRISLILRSVGRRVSKDAARLCGVLPLPQAGEGV